jgi:hypothetical protein
LKGHHGQVVPRHCFAIRALHSTRCIGADQSGHEYQINDTDPLNHEVYERHGKMKALRFNRALKRKS